MHDQNTIYKIGGMSYKYPLGVCTLNISGHLSCTSLCCKSGMAPEYTGSLKVS